MCGKRGVDTKGTGADKTEEQRRQQPQLTKEKEKQQHRTAEAAATPRQKEENQQKEERHIGPERSNDKTGSIRRGQKRGEEPEKDWKGAEQELGKTETNTLKEHENTEKKETEPKQLRRR